MSSKLRFISGSVWRLETRRLLRAMMEAMVMLEKKEQMILATVKTSKDLHNMEKDKILTIR